MHTSIARRVLLRLSVGSILMPLGLDIKGAGSATPESYADSHAADLWMSSWIDAAAAPGGAKAPYNSLHLSRFADPIYFVTREIGWDPSPAQRKYPQVRVPAGFVTDFASIPRIFWSVLRPDGLYSYAAIVHDFLYWEQPVTRSAADDIFKFVMQDFMVGQTTIAVIDAAVRAGVAVSSPPGPGACHAVPAAAPSRAVPGKPRLRR